MISIASVSTAADRPRSPEHRADPRDELLGAERLRQIIIRAGVEAGHAIGRRGSCGEHDHGYGASLSHLSKHLEPVEPRHHDIEKNKCVFTANRSREPSPPVVNRLESKSLLCEIFAHELTQFNVIVDQEDRGGGR